MYPLIFEPVFKEMIWGGSRLRDFGKNILSDKTGESWDVTCRQDKWGNDMEMSVVANGPLKGRTLAEVTGADPGAWLGRGRAAIPPFPLLVKTIDANDNLSVQVHPDDGHAADVRPPAEHEAEPALFSSRPLGKAEMWYILEPPADGYLIVGLKPGVTREMFRLALKEGTVETLLGRLEVRAGDVIDIPPGLVHAITRGTVLAEIQQNSDITYRVYDYNRAGLDGKPRELHVDKALDVINFDNGPVEVVAGSFSLPAGQETKFDGYTLTQLIRNKHFVVEKYDIATRVCMGSPAPHSSNGIGVFSIFTCVRGRATVSGGGPTLGSRQSVELGPGQSVFMPAAIGEYTLDGDCALLKSFVAPEAL
ncbi:MAG: class I mannose-6-phosphate isomerase [Clostridiales bacterium]|nr:class I mannose-6-phosphate isomerase [Clostridiales bacterium]